MSSNITITFKPLEGAVMPPERDVKFFLDSAEYGGYDDFMVSEKHGYIGIYDTKCAGEWIDLPHQMSEFFPELRWEYTDEWDDEGPGAEASVWINGVKVREGVLEWVWNDVKLVSE